MDRVILTPPCPPDRARRGLGVAALVAAVALLAATPAVLRAADDDPDGPGPLPWRVHGAVAFTVDAAAFPDSAGQVLDLYLRIPPGTMTELERDTHGAGQLRFTVHLSGRGGMPARDASEEFAVAPGDSVAGLGKVVLMRFPVRPGRCRLRVKLEDVNTQKRGIGYLGRKVHESADVEGDLVVPAPQAGRELSDLEFLWPSPTGAGAAFRRGDQAQVPNPDRLYGLFATQVQARFLARGPLGDTRVWHWHARVLDTTGVVVAEQESTAAAANQLAARVALELSSAPAGGYDLEVKAWQEGDAGALLRTARFSVGWEAGTWLVDPGDAEDLVHFLLSSDDEHRFARLQPGERERFLDQYWHDRDPSPETAENEAKSAFFARVDYANRNFGGLGVGRGMFSDMGRVFIRYGEPGEILKQVIPAGDETLANVLQQLELSEDRPTGDVHQKGLGGDTRAYEVWIYQGDVGAPPDTDPAITARLRPRRRLVFLFVDEHGYGLYTLRYSTE